jgi:hypothetical protein
LAKQVVYLGPGILAKLDADPAIRKAMHRDRQLPGPVRGFEEGLGYRFFLTAGCCRQFLAKAAIAASRVAS